MRSTRPVRALALVTLSLAAWSCDAGAAPSGPLSNATVATPTGAASSPAPANPAASMPVATAGSVGLPVHLVKDCSTYTAEIPSYCQISSSDYPPIPVGAKVVYLGPLLDNPYFLSSNVRIDDAHGNTATGYCIFDGRPTEERGFCTFWAGTGALAGFTAIFKVSIDTIGEWHLDGERYGNTQSPGPS